MRSLVFFELYGKWTDRFLFAFLMSLLISLVLTGLSIPILRKIGVMDEPGERKIHSSPVPRLGGMAIYIAFVLPMLMIWEFNYPQQGVILGSGIALLIGAADDIWGVPAIVKLAALLGLTLLVREFGVITNIPFERFGLPHDITNVLASMLWITGICSAMNALDHMDGMASSISIIAAVAYISVSIQSGQVFWGLLSVALSGALTGFLFYNRHPAKIFMGDSGSFFLGFALASIGILGGWSRNPIKASIIPVAVLSLPIFDLAYVIFSRRLRGTTRSIRESIVYCGKDHIGHRLVDAGFSQTASVSLVCVVSACVSISALTIRYTKMLESFFLVLQIALIYVIILLLMEKLRDKTRACQ